MPQHRSRNFVAVTATAVAIFISLSVAGCGFNVQTLQADSPGQGVNVDVGDVKLRDIVVRTVQGERAVIHGAITSTSPDQLVSVTGWWMSDDGTRGQAFTASGTPLAVPGEGLLRLPSDSGSVTIPAAGEAPGNDVEVVFTFRSGNQTSFLTIVNES